MHACKCRTCGGRAWLEQRAPQAGAASAAPYAPRSLHLSLLGRSLQQLLGCIPSLLAAQTQTRLCTLQEARKQRARMQGGRLLTQEAVCKPAARQRHPLPQLPWSTSCCKQQRPRQVRSPPQRACSTSLAAPATASAARWAALEGSVPAALAAVPEGSAAPTCCVCARKGSITEL